MEEKHLFRFDDMPPCCDAVFCFLFSEIICRLVVMHYCFVRSWCKMICSHILRNGQTVMNPAGSFDVFPSEHILCTSKTLAYLQIFFLQIFLLQIYFLQIYCLQIYFLQKNAWNGLDLEKRAIWEGYWHNGDIFSLWTIRFCNTRPQKKNLF